MISIPLKRSCTSTILDIIDGHTTWRFVPSIYDLDQFDKSISTLRHMMTQENVLHASVFTPNLADRSDLSW
jgi:hypothetical protein